MYSIASVDSPALKILCVVLGVFLCSSCSASDDSIKTSEVIISKVHGICASAPKIVAEKSEVGPDFDYGVLLAGRDKRVEYYSSAQPSHRDALLKDSKLLRGLRSDRISVAINRYSDDKDGISLLGYVNKINGKMDVKVEYLFPSRDEDARRVAESLATTTRSCDGSPHAP